MKNKANPKHLLRQTREQVTLEAVQGTDGQAYLVYESTRVRLATPMESAKVIPLIKKIVSNALDCTITRSEARDIFESMEGELLATPGGKSAMLPRVGFGENGPEVLLDSNKGTVVQFNGGKYEIVRGGTATFINSPEANGFLYPLRMEKLIRGINRFRKITRLPTDDCMLVILWILHTYLPQGPYLLLIINGESGSGKSILTECIRLLVDPSSVPTLDQPKNEKELFGAAQSNHVIAIDNASKLKTKLLDGLCRISTGGGISIHKGNRLADQKAYHACRPVILNSIGPVALRNDVLQRSIVINLGHSTNNVDAEIALDNFKAECPRILGSLFQAVAHGLSRIDEIGKESSFRMAGFLAWSIAAGSAFGWSEEKIRSVYAKNQTEAFSRLGESDTLLIAIRELVRREGEWHGTATELLGRLKEIVLQGANRDEMDIKGFPKGANALSGRLDRAREALNAFGIQFDRGQSGGGKDRFIHLTPFADREAD